jgi:LmbE family N-acetylglucosaminyl deacetylase
MLLRDIQADYQPKTVLAVGAHPDDIDVMAGGSIAAWTKNGAEVTYLVLTDGRNGSSDRSTESDEVVVVRQAEQRAAAETLGVNQVVFLDYEDGYLENTKQLRADIVKVIRKVKPDTVVVMDPTMVYSSELGIINHPDHRAAGQATLDAVFPLARDHLSYPEHLLQDKLEPHKVAHVLLTNFTKQNCFTDISGTFDLKLAAIAKHASQFADITPMRQRLQGHAEKLGKEPGYRYAEGFVRIDCSTD